jgi:hypothetical protein
MKKVLLILGISIAVLVVVGAGAIFLLHRSGSAQQEKFFTAVESGKVNEVMALFHPSVREEFDEPVLAAWMAAMRKNFGKYQGLSATHFSSAVRYQNNAKIVESKGTVNFEKGTVQSEIHSIDDLIVAIDVAPEQLPADWFQGPVGTELYRRRGEQFLTNLMSDKYEAAHQMTHENFQKNIPLEKLKDAVAGVREDTGKLKSVTYKAERFVADTTPPELILYYDVTGENAETPAKVVFQFIPFKGHLVMFNVGPNAEEGRPEKR